MKITYVKFFQPVNIERASGGNDVMTYIQDKAYDISLDGLLITVTAKGSTARTIVTLHNVCFLKVEDEHKAKKGGGNPGAPKKES